MRFKARVAVVVLSTMIAFYAIIGGLMTKTGEAVARQSPANQLEVFDEVLSHIIRNYVDQPDLEKDRIGSLRGLTEGVDIYSAYLTPEQVKQYNPAANQAEIGVVLSKVGGYAYTLAVLKGSPADQAGIRKGDFIEYIGKVPSRELSLYDAQQLLSGPAGSPIELRIVHLGQSRKISVPRARIIQPAIESRAEEAGIGYIRVTTLVDGKANEVKSQLSDLVAKGAQKIILDLRDSSNGKLQEGVAVANLFIGTGTLARLEGKESRDLQSFAADPNKVMFNGPLTVLTDRTTANAAEIVAAAVRDQKRGEVVGDRTFGAGTEQKLFSLSDGGALLITTAKYAPASGKAFIEEGVTPTVKVERPAEPEVAPTDSDDDDSDETPQTVHPKVEPQATPPAEDIQLKKAIEILKQAPAKSAAPTKRAAINSSRNRTRNDDYEFAT